MRHAYKYSGSFETNYSDLAPGLTTYKAITRSPFLT